METIILRGDIFWVNLPERDGSVQGSTRPAVITSNDKNNTYSTTVNVIPITSQLDKGNYPMHVTIGTECGVDKTSIALCEQETTVSKKRLLSYIGHCTDKTLKRLEQGIMIQRGISDPFNITRVRRLIFAIQEANRLLPNSSPIVDTLKRELITYCKQYGKTLKDINVVSAENNKIRQLA